MSSVPIRALLLGERLDMRAFEQDKSIATAPLTLAVADRAFVMLFRYGAAVLFGVSDSAEKDLLARLSPHVIAPFAVPEREEARLRIDPAAEEQVDSAGVIILRQDSPERLQAVAIAVAKSLLLSHYEARLGSVFDRIEPFAEALASGRGRAARSEELTRHIGHVLLIQHKMVGRAEIQETPELIWEHPELERLYARLAEEYELRDRDRALDRKLEVIARTAETLLGLVQSRSSQRVEWYILLLIIAELILSVFPPAQWH